MILAINLALVTGTMSILWLVSLRRRDASIVDRFWGLGFVVVATSTTLMLGDSRDWRGLLLTALTAVWGLRLSLHITWRNWGQGEDPRYQAMRRHHGERFGLVSLGTVFGLQAALMFVISLPLQLGQRGGPAHVTILDGVGVSLWLIGFAFETIGDAQLARFKADPASRGRILDRGLWRYTRHPNYFGDAVVWWGLYALAANTPAGRWTFAAPLVMTLLLRRVSGVTLLERSLVRTRPGYADYVDRTPAFFPWRPRRPRGESAAGQSPREREDPL